MGGQAMQNNLDPITGIRCDIADRTHGDNIGMFTVKPRTRPCMMQHYAPSPGTCS